ncbi:MAG: 16S rRNA processing protein RimM [Chloroflexi bacterium]|nr:16S rRNA processing protein RimM [Chloroflexota bacterium]
MSKALRPPRARRRKSESDPQFLAIGKVLRPQGVRGELRLEIYTGSPAHLKDVETVYVGDEQSPYPLESSRLHQKILLIKLKGCDDREQADSFRGQIIAIARADAAPLRAGQFYHHQIIGLAVISDEGEQLGSITEIIETGANDVYVVKNGDEELLLPAISSVILKIEPPQMIVHLLDGLR